MSATHSHYEKPPPGWIPTSWQANEITRPTRTRTPQQMVAQKRFENTQAQVDEVVDLMKANTVSVLERDYVLTELEQRGETLAEKANEFHTGTSKLRKRQCFEHYKIWIIMGIAITLIVLAVIWLL